MTDTPIDSVCFSIVSLCGIWLLTFADKLNNLEAWATNIGHVYLKLKTKELVCIIAGPEFGAQQGQALVVIKALHSLKSSGLNWHEQLSDMLLEMGFEPSMAERDI